jgi:hypothetical protein
MARELANKLLDDYLANLIGIAEAEEMYVKLDAAQQCGDDIGYERGRTELCIDCGKPKSLSLRKKTRILSSSNGIRIRRKIEREL